MEDNPYSALKSSLSSTLATCLNDASRQVLAKLDLPQTLTSHKGYSRNYRGLSELMGFTHDQLQRFEIHKDVTKRILELWQTRTDSTLDKLIGYLEDMDREDIIEELIPSLRRDVAKHAEQESPVQVNEVTSGTMIRHSNRSFLTRDDVTNGKCTIYDAYLSYADDDTNIAFEVAQKLESNFGLHLYIPDRDLLAGHLQLDTDIEMMNRCRCIIMVLTPNFVVNPILEFQVSFAASLAIERNENLLIPIILEHCEIPPILSKISKINFTNKLTHQWMWRKLVLSVRSKTNVSSPSLGNGNMDAISNSTGATSDDASFNQQNAALWM